MRVDVTVEAVMEALAECEGSAARASVRLGCSEDVVRRRMRTAREQATAEAALQRAAREQAVAAVMAERRAPQPLPVPTTSDWRHRAACLTEDPELFFPIGNTGPAVLQAEEAKAVCRRCDVVEACLRWALDTGQDHGVWGGLTEDERRALKRRNARARRAS